MWKYPEEELPELFERVEVIAFEFGQPPEYIAAEFWQSSEPEQPPRFYFDQETYELDCPCLVASKVRLWRTRVA